MFYKKETYILTHADKSLVNSLSEYLFGEPDSSQITLPFIILDCFLEPVPIKRHPWLEKEGTRKKNSRETLMNQLIERQGKETSVFDIEMMGKYTPDDYTITLFDRAISANAYLLDVDETDLRAITLIHLLSHYIIHCPFRVLEPHWDESVTLLLHLLEEKDIETRFLKMDFHIASPDYLRMCSQDLIETLAQLQTYLIVKDKPEFHDILFRLAEIQSDTYSKFREDLDTDFSEFRLAMSLIRHFEYVNKIMPDIKPAYPTLDNLDNILKKHETDKFKTTFSQDFGEER